VGQGLTFPVLKAVKRSSGNPVASKRELEEGMSGRAGHTNLNRIYDFRLDRTASGVYGSTS